VSDVPEFIVTGVDRLVDLLEKKKRVSTAEAAKLIGVTQPIITEWANFLEEEGFLKIDFKMRDTYLVKTDLTKSQRERISKEFWHHRGAFVYPIERPPRGRKKIGSGVYDLRNAIEELQEQMERFMDKTERHLSELKQTVHTDENSKQRLSRKEVTLSKKIAALDTKLYQEKRRFQEIIKQAKDEKSRLEKEQAELLTLKNSEQRLEKQLNTVNSTVQTMAGQLQEEKKEIHDLQKDKQEMRTVEADLLLQEKDYVRRELQKCNELRAALWASRDKYDPLRLE